MQSEFFYRFGKLRLFAGANLIPTWKRVKIEIRNGASIYDIVDTHLIHIQYIYLVPIQYRQATSHPFDRVPILSRSLSRSWLSKIQVCFHTVVSTFICRVVNRTEELYQCSSKCSTHRVNFHRWESSYISPSPLLFSLFSNVQARYNARRL